MYQKLFTPIKIRSMELKNRIVLPAMGTKFSGKTSYVTDQLIDYHVARVKGGTGLSIVEVCSVHFAERTARIPLYFRGLLYTGDETADGCDP